MPFGQRGYTQLSQTVFFDMKFSASKGSGIYIISCVIWFIVTACLIVLLHGRLASLPSMLLQITMPLLFVLANAFVVYKLIKINNKSVAQKELDFFNLYLGNPNPLWIYDPVSLKFLSVNDAAIVAYGYTREEFLKMGIQEIRPPEDFQKVAESSKKVSGLRFTPGVWRHIKKDGTIIYVNITSHQIKFEQQNCIMVLATDTTNQVEYELELKQINQVLQEEKQKLKETEKLARVSGWEYFVKDGSLIWSDELYEIFDMDRESEKVNYSRILKSVHKEDLFAYNQAIENLLKYGKDLNIEYRFITKTGKVKYAKVLGKMQYLNNKMFKVHGTMQDITELKLIQIEKNTYQQRLKTTLNTIADSYFLLNHQWRITALNHNCEKIMGFKQEEVLNRNYLDVFPNAINLKFYQNFKKVLEEHLPVYFEEYSPKANRWFRVNAYPTDEGAAIYLSDVTEDKEKDLQLKEALERYDLVGKATQDVIYDCDAINHKSQFGHNIKQLLCLSEDKVVPDNIRWWKDRIHPDDLPAVVKTYKAAIKNKTTNCGLEYRVKTDCGLYKYVYDQGYLKYNQDQKFVRMIGAFKDIDKLKRFDDENKRLADIITNVNNMIIIQDVNEKIVWVNEAFERTNGYCLTEVIGKTPQEVLFGPETDLSNKSFIFEARKNLERFSFQLINYTKQKKKYWVNIECTPLFTPSGKLDGFIYIHTDITLLKEKSEKVSRQNEMLRNVAWLSSHELRKPVASILGLIELINDTDDASEKEESIQLMNQCTRHLDEIIRKINTRLEEEISKD